jgi:hypothetical protein
MRTTVARMKNWFDQRIPLITENARANRSTHCDQTDTTDLADTPWSSRPRGMPGLAARDYVRRS